MNLGIMQGRLVAPEAGRFQCFPRERWRDEFALAALAGLDTIEWIYDAYGEDVNPIGNEKGIQELCRLSEKNHVGVKSICADWFMDFPLLRCDETTVRQRWDQLGWLMGQCAALKIHRIVVPFVDNSAIQTNDEAAAVASGLNAMGSLVDLTDTEIHLETSLSPAAFKSLLDQVLHPRIKVNYDSGNSASLDFRPRDEFAAYGEKVGSVHLKDRIKNGGTVPIGKGDTDFAALFECLKDINYRGDFILQVARGITGGEFEWARQNVLTSRKWMAELEDYDAG